jgi:hypothetical protein
MKKLRRIMAALLVLTNAGIFGLSAAAQSNKPTRKTTSRPAINKSSSKTTPTVFDNPALVKRYQQAISPDALAARLYFLASDFFEGRETGARGQRLAAQYLASQYRQMGLTPKGSVKPVNAVSPSAYLQPFTLFRTTPQAARLEVEVKGSKIASSVFSSETNDDLSYFLSGNAKTASGGVIFAGYGIADDRLGYNDYAALSAQGISTTDKWVLVLGDEPLADAATSRLPTADRKPSSWSTQFINKRRALLKSGRPKGILVISDASPRLQGAFSANAAAASANAQRIGQMSLFESSDIPQAYAVSTKLADQMLATSGTNVETLKRQINQSLKPNVFELKDVTVNATVEKSKRLETENVLAFIEGTDPKLKDEVIIVSSHYDHLGVNPLLKGDQIFNGAADDGSGAVASLELAQALMNAQRDGFGPRRSILFINFSAEEKGTLGSSYYAYSAPVIPLKKTVANINMDGVGGIDPKHPTGSKNYIYIAADQNLSSELVGINKRVKGILGSRVELTDAPAGFNSDNINFQNQLIPFIYYSSGFTEYYHQPGDEPETIDYEHLAQVTQLIFGTLWQIANQDARISSVDRSRLQLAGYVCPPCPFECDTEVYDRLGVCPVCGMNLKPNYSTKAD